MQRRRDGAPHVMANAVARSRFRHLTPHTMPREGPRVQPPAAAPRKICASPLQAQARTDEEE